MALHVKKKKKRIVKRETLKPPTVKAKSILGPVSLENIELVRTQGTANKGGGGKGEDWVIFAGGKRAGTAYINIIEDKVRGVHASFHIFLNRPSQGRQIGRAAYRLACELSQHDIIYAHMSKSNTASRKAAEHAGFINTEDLRDSQLVLVWRRVFRCGND